ncbi:unnamed protein product, partial [Adineta ricciae]
VKPVHKKRQYANTPVSSSTGNIWTTMTETHNVQIMPPRILMIQDGGNQQILPIDPIQKVSRSTSISSSTMGGAYLIGKKATCLEISLMIFGILTTLAALTALGISIYLLTNIRVPTKTCMITVTTTTSTSATTATTTTTTSSTTPDPACSAIYFSNGDFESGTSAGWTIGGGYRNGDLSNNIYPDDYLSGGSHYNLIIANTH